MGLGARQCDVTVGCVRFGANGRNLDKSDLHPGLDVLQRHRRVAAHDYERWSEQLDVERRFGWRQFEWRKFERGSRRRRPGPRCRSDLSRSRPFAPKRTQPPVRSHCLAPSPILFATHGGRSFV